MITKLMRVTILVKDQEAALAWYTEKLGFEKRADQVFGPAHRWLTVAPKEQQELEIVLLQPNPKMQGEAGAKELTNRVGQNPAWVLATDDCRGDYDVLVSRGVEFVSSPEDLPWGVSAVFVDLYGNSFNLLQPR